MTLLACRGLTVEIAGRRVCEALDLQLDAGQCWGMLGCNGAGKTTLLHTLAGLRAAQDGEILLADRPLTAWPDRERARHLGLLLQDNREVFPGTVLETVLIGRHPHLQRWEWEGEADLAKARSALAAVDLAGFEARDVATLSGGEYQRLQIATLLAQAPRVMLLDEPVNHLDLKHQAAILTRLTDMARQAGHALLMVLHDVNLAARYCDHLLLIYGNGETRQGGRDAVLDKPALERLYGCALREIRDGTQRWFMAD